MRSAGGVGGGGRDGGEEKQETHGGRGGNIPTPPSRTVNAPAAGSRPAERVGVTVDDGPQQASTRLALTPTVPHERTPSLERTTTRVCAEVPSTGEQRTL
jgi:hypothetical protein